MKFGLKISIFIFCILFLFSCSEENNNEKTPKSIIENKVEKYNKSIVLNGENIEISNENFVKLELIIKKLDAITCDSPSRLKLNDFFDSVKLKFNKDYFSLAIIGISGDMKSELKIEYKPNSCVINTSSSFSKD